MSNFKWNRKHTAYTLIAVLLAGALIWYFNSFYKKKQLIADGQALENAYCSSCHLAPDPQKLDKDSWISHVLPAMAPYLGGIVKPNGEIQFDNFSEISEEEWTILNDYFREVAPQKLPVQHREIKISDALKNFEVHTPGNRDTSLRCATSVVKIDTLFKRVLFGDAAKNTLNVLSPHLTAINNYSLQSPPVGINLYKDGQAEITCIGSLLASNLKNGSVVLANNSKEGLDAFSAIPYGFNRPVDAKRIDYNRDRIQDWVVCEFGHDWGGLYLLQGEKDGGFKPKTISSLPGAEQAEVVDYNGDGWPDIVALFAQGREGIWLFENDHKGGFKPTKLMEFEPEYGSTSFQLVDFNDDGKLDILYTCGDNGDFSQVFKPYHGVYLFLNSGNDQFKQAFFYPINGCTKVLAADFDNDVDIDFVTIAFFADYGKQPEESFVYFENKDNLHFIPQGLPIQNTGRWISMDIGDVDGDGDIDIVLGNFLAEDGFSLRGLIETGWRELSPVILLENKLR